MTVTNKDCIEYIVDWIQQNPSVLPRDQYTIDLVKLQISRDGKTHITDGTKKGSWKRRAKKNVNGQILRGYDHSCTTLADDICAVVVEQNGQIQTVLFNTRAFFEHTYGLRLKYSFE